MATTSTYHGSRQWAAKYNVGFKIYKTARRVKMREVKIYRNGAWIYCDAFTMEERETHEAWARVFLNARKLKDTRQYQHRLSRETCPGRSLGLPAVSR